MVRAYLALPLAALASGCAIIPDAWKPSWLPFVGDKNATAQQEGLRAEIADDLTLVLPTPPGYPEERTIIQTGRAQFGERRMAFEAVLALGFERTEIVLMMPAGPRLSTIVWDATGVHEDRAPFVPDSLPVENILADIFVTVWPEASVVGTLPEGVTMDVAENGTRTIRRGDEIILTVGPDAADPSRFVVRNEAIGYEVVMTRQEEEVLPAEAGEELAPSQAPPPAEPPAETAPPPVIAEAAPQVTQVAASAEVSAEAPSGTQR
jgi:hypothetical protein